MSALFFNIGVLTSDAVRSGDVRLVFFMRGYIDHRQLCGEQQVLQFYGIRHVNKISQ